MSAFADNQWFEVVSCGHCGIPFCMSLDFYRKRQEDHKSWYCPNGHQRQYNSESEASKLKRELERTRQMQDAAEARANTAENERHQIATAHRKMRVRVMNGVCPCCNRQFPNLLRHMQTQHPDFKETRTLNVLRTAFGMTQAQVAKEAGVTAVYVSAYEREAYLPAYAKERLTTWIETHEAKE